MQVRERARGVAHAGRLGLVLALAMAFAPPAARATDVFHDDFSTGLSPANWVVRLSAGLPLYTVDAGLGFVSVRKPIDPTRTGDQAVWINFTHPVVGNFTAEIQYHLASLQRTGGGAGNDVALLGAFSSQGYSVRRASEDGPTPESYYAWVVPPGFAYGRTATAANAGMLRLQRQSILVFASADGATLFTGVVDGDTLQSIAFGLENRGTTDSTSVVFDDFQLIADQILWSEPVAGAGAPSGRGYALSLSPNPARGQVVATLELPRGVTAHVTVVDVQGRRVASLLDGPLPAGRREVSWRVPAAVPPGLYFVVAEYPGQTLRSRLALTR